MNTRRAGVRSRTTALVAVFLCIEFLDEVIDGLSGAAWPLIRVDLGLTYTQIGLLLSAPALFAYVVEPAVGLLGDVWRRFLLIVLGGLAFATALTMYAGATGFITLMAAMLLFYPASGTFVSLSQSSLMDLMTGEEERGMVLWTIAGSVGVAAGPLLLAASLAIDGGWRSVYAALAFAALLLAGLVWAARPRVGLSPSERATPREALRHAGGALRTPNVLRWLGVLAAVDLILDVLVSFLALYFVDVVRTSPGFAALAVTGWTVAALAGEASLAGLLRRFDGLVLVRRSAWVVLVLVPAFLLVPGRHPKLALGVLLGLLTAGWYSIVKARYFIEFEGRTGTAMAVSSVFGPVQALMPALVGVLAERFGLGTALWLVIVAPIAVLVGTGPIHLGGVRGEGSPERDDRGRPHVPPRSQG